MSGRWRRASLSLVWKRPTAPKQTDVWSISERKNQQRLPPETEAQNMAGVGLQTSSADTSWSLLCIIIYIYIVIYIAYTSSSFTAIVCNDCFYHGHHTVSTNTQTEEEVSSVDLHVVAAAPSWRRARWTHESQLEAGLFVLRSRTVQMHRECLQKLQAAGGHTSDLIYPHSLPNPNPASGTQTSGAGPGFTSQHQHQLFVGCRLQLSLSSCCVCLKATPDPSSGTRVRRADRIRADTRDIRRNMKMI